MTTQTILEQAGIPLLFICDLYVLWIETDDFAGCFNHSGKE